MARDVLRDRARCLPELRAEERVVEPTYSVEVRDQDLRREDEPGTREERDPEADPPVVATIECEVRATQHEQTGKQEDPVAVRVEDRRQEQADDDRADAQENAPKITTQAERDEQAEHDDRERDIFFAAQRDERGNGEPSPAPF